MEATNIELIIATLNTVIYITGVGDFCLGGCINSVSRSKGRFTFSYGLATCSFGGLTRDIILTPLLTGGFVIPGLLNSTETWLITVTVVSAFIAVYRIGKFEVFEQDSFTLPFLTLDALALGNFTVIGVLAATKLGYSSVAVQILYGFVTATGGGIFSILIWARNKRKLIRENVWYYTTAVISSGIACVGISMGFNCEAVYLACSAFCAAVYLTRKAAAEGIRNACFRSYYCRINTGINYYMGRIRSGEYFCLVKSIPHERLKLFYYLIKQKRAFTGMHGMYCSS